MNCLLVGGEKVIVTGWCGWVDWVEVGEVKREGGTNGGVDRQVGWGEVVS